MHHADRQVPSFHPADRARDVSETGRAAPIRVLVAEDHAVVRQAVRLLLDGAGDIEVVGESVDVASTLDAGRALHPDVVVCDLMMPDGTMLSELRRLIMGGSAVVVLTMAADPAFEREALRLGASRFLLKDAPPEELVAAVRATRPMTPA